MKPLNLFILLFFLTIQLGASESDILIIYTNNTNGILENCQCPEHAFGALEKRAWYIDSLRKANDNVILIDAGDILDIRKDSLLHSYVLQAYSTIDYDYWVPGDQDFVEGLDFFQDVILQLNMNLINTNIYIKDRLPGNRFKIQELSTVKIGITGTINHTLYKYLDEEIKSQIRFSDQIQSLTPVINKLSKESDFVILISHSGFENDRILAQQFPDIDLIIGGHSQTIVSDTQKEGNTLIVQAGESGYRIGELHLTFKDKSLNSYNNQLYLLDKLKPDHPEVLQLIKEYHRKRLMRLGRELSEDN